MKTFLLFILAFCSLSGRPQLLSSGLPEEGNSKAVLLQGLVQQFTRAGLPGVVVALQTPKGTWSFAAGHARLENRQPMQSDHQLMVASVTKMFLAVVTLRLAEQGKVNLDQPLTAYRCGPLFRKIRHADKITIRHLLNHTSGLPDFVKHPAFFLNVLDKPHCNWRQRDLLKYLKRQPPLFRPGEKGSYSNSNFLLLAVLLDNELIEGQGHAERIQNEIIKGLGLTQTFYSSQRTIPSHAATGYAEIYNNKKIFNVNDINTGGAGNGFSGLYSTAEDLQKFVKALFVDKRLLKDSFLLEMKDFVSDSEERNVSFGLGIWKEALTGNENIYGLGHRGRDLAYTSDVWWFPQRGVSVVVLANCGAVMDSRLTRTYKEFRRQLFQMVLNNF